MYNNIVKENRKEDLDILRVIAIIFVLSVHGLSYIGFYEHRFSGGVMFILSVVRTSYIFDVVLYYIVKHIFNNIAGLSLVLPFTILVNLILSTLTSFFITEISEKLYKVISKKMLD